MEGGARRGGDGCATLLGPSAPRPLSGTPGGPPRHAPDSRGDGCATLLGPLAPRHRSGTDVGLLMSLSGSSRSFPLASTWWTRKFDAPNT
eukprot:13646249-Heterocapsa_arctica.AAC.1